MTDDKFILIDDDPISNLVTRFIIEKVLGKIDIQVFTNAQHGLVYIESAYSEANSQKTILLLDINMPIMTGWEFLERFDKFPDSLKKSICIYILTSTPDWRDKDRSKNNKNVIDHLVKPLTADAIKTIIEASQTVS